jgi:hypothetical protein
MLENYSCSKTFYHYNLDYIYKYNLKNIYNVLKINKINYKIIFLSKINLLKKQKQQTYNFLLRIFFILYIYSAYKGVIKCNISKKKDIYKIYFITISITKKKAILSLLQNLMLGKKRFQKTKYNFEPKKVQIKKAYISNSKVISYNFIFSLTYLNDLHFLFNRFFKSYNIRSYLLGINIISELEKKNHYINKLKMYPYFVQLLGNNNKKS